MTGREFILRAVKNQATPRPAWLPFVGVHGAHLIDVTAADYLKSADLLVDGLSEAKKRYKPDALPVAFDLQIEAEVLGCQLNWVDDGPPSVYSHPMSRMEGDGKSLEELPEFSIEAGRMPVVLEATRRMREKFGDQLGLYGLICGPFTLALHLLGNDIFLEMFDQPNKVQNVIDFGARVGKQAARAYLEAGVDVVAVVDPMTSQISPQHFEQFVAPYVNDLFDEIREAGGLSSLFVCGDATRNLHVMCQTHCDNLSIDENIALHDLRDLATQTGKSYGGNLRLTTVLLLGKPDDARLDAIRCIEIGDSHGFILAPGCDLPFSTPPENLEAVADMVHDEYQRSVASRTIVAQAADTFDDIELPDYAHAPEVYVDVVTLDSASCAPCQYMVGAVAQARQQLHDFGIVIREHKITTREGLGYMTRLGVEAIPSICIDGEVAFASIIPDSRSLAQKIVEKAEAKSGG